MPAIINVAVQGYLPAEVGAADEEDDKSPPSRMPQKGRN